MIRDAPADWNPRFLCYSIRGPIILSDGRVTTCTLDHEGQNEIGNIYEDDFETIVENYGRTRLTSMADPVSKPMCFKCYNKLPRWKDQRVPRADWINKGCSSEEKQDFLNLFDPDAIRINLELSSKCNLRCIGCSVAKPEFKYSRGSTALDLDSLKKWVGNHGRRIAHVRLYHMGETWLHPQWDQICQFLKTENPAIRLFTSTNGMPMQVGNTVERAIESKIDHIMFSIHGARQASVEKYMGTGFKLDVALAMAGKLAGLRDRKGSALHLSWKYVIFSWNDSEEEIREAKRICDETGFDEIHFSITSYPSPSERLAKGTEDWVALQNECASLWKRGEDYLKTAPMSALYPGRRQREHNARDSKSVAPLKLVQSPSLPSVFSGQEKSVIRKGALNLGARRLVGFVRGFADGEIKRGIASVLEGRPFEGARRLERSRVFFGEWNEEARFRLGEAYLSLHRFEEALQNFGRVIESQNGTATEFHFLGKARALRGLDRWQEAYACYEQALQRRLYREERAYGEDIYVEMAAVFKKLGNEKGVKTTYRLWREFSYVKHTASPQSIYCPIPKNACTYLKTAFVQNSKLADAFKDFGGDAHQFLRNPKNQFRLQNLDFLKRPKYFSFVVLRNPFDRLASAYSNLFVRPLKWHALPDPSARGAVIEIQRAKGEKPNAARSATFEEFIRYVAKAEDYDLDYHFRPQSTFFGDLEDFDFVGRVEDMDDVKRVLAEKLKWSFAGVEAFNQTAHGNGKPSNPYHRTSPQHLQKIGIFPRASDLFTDELRDLVRDRYAADFATYERAFSREADLV